MVYKWDSFLKPLAEGDTVIKILDNNGLIKHSIDPFSIINTFINNNIVKINIKGEVILINFSTSNEAKIALPILQSQIDILKQNTNPFVDRKIENFVDSKISSMISPAYLNYFDYSSSSSTSVVINTWIKLNTLTTEGYSNDGLLHSNNRITNTGSSRLFKMQAILSVSADNNNEVHFAFFRNGELIPCSEQSVVMSPSNRYNAAPIQCLVELDTNQYIEVWVKNSSSGADIILDNINVICQQL